MRKIACSSLAYIFFERIHDGLRRTVPVYTSSDNVIYPFMQVHTFSCAFESAALPTLSMATASGHCKHKLVYSCFSLGLFGTPPVPWARLCHQRPVSSPPPPRVQPRQQPSLPRASSAPSAGGLGGLVVMNGVGRCTVTESMTRLKR